MQTYSLREIQSILALSKSVIDGLVAAGFVNPSRGKRREYRFTFQDLVLLRTAHSLQAAQIPPRKIVQSLRRLRETLPEELPLTGLRITAVGNQIVVRDGALQRHVDSGQLLMDFDVAPSAGTLAIHAAKAQPPVLAGDAVDWFERGVELESADPAQAEAAYRRAIEQAPAHTDPVLNLGVMLCDGGRHDEAIALYRQALEVSPQEPLLHFNLAVALEDAGHTDEALAGYAHCTRLAPKFADAHFNAARLHEELGHATLAIRHYSEYRRLQS
jgi:tetratricopeptide (TPR) repeat protein